MTSSSAWPDRKRHTHMPLALAHHHRDEALEGISESSIRTRKKALTSYRSRHVKPSSSVGECFFTSRRFVGTTEACSALYGCIEHILRAWLLPDYKAFVGFTSVKVQSSLSVTTYLSAYTDIHRYSRTARNDHVTLVGSRPRAVHVTP